MDTYTLLIVAVLLVIVITITFMSIIAIVVILRDSKTENFKLYVTGLRDILKLFPLDFKKLP